MYKFLKVIKCKLGYHEWDEVGCTKFRTCRRCSAFEVKPMQEHVWSKWEPDEVACYDRRLCSDCGGVEKRGVRHEWEPWYTVSLHGSQATSSGCKKRRTCRYCPASETKLERHRWSEWESDVAVCSEIHTCLDCGGFEKRNQHEWGEWEKGITGYFEFTEKYRSVYSNETVYKYRNVAGCKKRRTCRRCLAIEETPMQEHVWSKWEPDEVAYYERQTCTNCGTIDKRSTQRCVTHEWGEPQSRESYGTYYNWQQCLRCSATYALPDVYTEEAMAIKRSYL